MGRSSNQPPNPGQAADLLRIAEASASGGFPACRIDGATRGVLMRRGWATALYKGEPAGPREWAADMFVTPAGEAAAREVIAQPVTLPAFAAAALEEVEAAGPPGRAGFYPGNAQALRIARAWQLINFTPHHPHSGALGVYRISAAGREAMKRWRAGLHEPAVPTPSQGKALDSVERFGYAPTADPATVLCLEFGWIARTGEPYRTHRLQPAGLDALTVFRAAAAAAAPAAQPGPARLLAGELAPGQMFRLAYRSRWRNLGPQWERFVRAERLPRPGGWNIWVDDGAGGERLYVDTPVAYQARFEVQPAAAGAEAAA